MGFSTSVSVLITWMVLLRSSDGISASASQTSWSHRCGVLPTAVSDNPRYAIFQVEFPDLSHHAR
jgi:hypothetical protein